MTTLIKKTDEIQKFLIFEDDYIINATEKLNKTKNIICYKQKKIDRFTLRWRFKIGSQKNLGLNEKIKKFSNKKIKFYQSQKK